MPEKTKPCSEQEARINRDDGHTDDSPIRHGESLPDRPSPSSPPSPVLPSLPGYEITAELGRGGMGVVYKAMQLSLKRVVALKMVLAGAQARPEDLVRFRREAEAVAHLQHDNIVKVFEVGEHEGRPYFTMEFVASGTLADTLGGTPQPFARAAELVERLGHGVHHAHERGVVHRDLKPANVLLAEDGTPKVVDFGLARWLQDDSSLTRQGEVLGTASYLAPEQASGKPGTAGPPADVYALGVILYELLTGRPPFKGETVLETLHQVLIEEPVSPAWLRPTLPRDLETICLKCLQKDSGKRYASALALAEDLRRFLNGEPITARRTPLWERGLKWVKRRPAKAALLAAGSLFLLVALAGGVWYADYERRQAGKERQLRGLAEEQELAARRALYEAHMNLAWQAWERGDIARVQELLEGLRPDKGGVDLRGPEWGYLSKLGHSERFAFPAHKGIIYSVHFSPDGKLLATGGEDRTVKLWDVATRSELRTLRDHTERVRFATFSPDGKLLATGGLDGRVLLWDVATGQRLHVLKAHKRTIYLGAFSPDGKLLATASRDGAVKLWETDTGMEKSNLPLPHSWPTCLAYSPDGKTLAIGSWDKTVTLWDLGTAQGQPPLKGHTGSVWSVAFTPDGKTVASASWDMTVKLWDVATGAERSTLQGHTDGIWGMAISPDGCTLATASFDATVKLWDLTTSQFRATLRGHTDQVRSVAFSPDSRTLISGGNDGFARGWDVATGLGLVTISGATDAIRAVQFMADSRKLISGTREGVLKLWHVTDGQLLTTLAAQENDILFLTLSPDGNTLASGGQDQTIHLWHWVGAEWQKRMVFRDNLAGVASLAFAPSGKLLASGGQSFKITLWDAATGATQASCRAHDDRVTGLVFSPDGATLISCSRDKSIKLWDAATLNQRTVLGKHTSEVQCMALASDGRTLATASYDTTVKLWDVVSERELATLKGHTGPVASLAFTPDGKTLVTGGGERARPGEIKIWDVAARQEIACLQGHAGAVWAVAISRDGKLLATADVRGVIKIWDLQAEIDQFTKLP